MRTVPEPVTPAPITRAPESAGAASSQSVDLAGPHWAFITTGTVSAPIDDLWAIVGDFAGLEAWHPRISSCVTDGSGIGSRRTVDLGDRVAVERLDELDDRRHIIAYTVVEGTPLTVGVSGRIQLEPAAFDTTSVQWLTTVPDRPGSADLVTRLKIYYRSRLDDLCTAVGRQ